MSHLCTLTSANSTPMTVRFGSRFATAMILYNEDEGDEERSDILPLPKYEICNNNTVQCDGIRDCQLGTDEMNCGKREHTHTLTHLNRTRTIQN